MSKKYLAVHPLTFIPNHSIGLEIYSWDERNLAFVKVLEPDDLLDQERQNHFAMLEEPNCYFSADMLPRYREILANNVSQQGDAAQIPEIVKLTIICEFIRYRLSDALESLSFDHWIESAYSNAREFDQNVKSISAGKIELLGRKVLFSLWKEGTFLNHSFNVGFYCYLLARCLRKKMNIELDPVECMVGGILHDTGKLCDNSDVNGNPVMIPLVGRIESIPFRKYDSHPTTGFELLMRSPAITKLPLLACYQHHERHNGKGYPVGLTSDQIEIGSSICAVANRWDGLMTDRKGHKAISRVNAIQTIQSEKSLYWNAEVVQCLAMLMS